MAKKEKTILKEANTNITNAIKELEKNPTGIELTDLLNQKKKYQAIFCIKEHNKFSFTGKKRFYPKTRYTIIEFKQHAYVIDIEKYSLVDGITNKYYIDMSNSTGQMLFSNHAKPIIDAKILDDVVLKHIMRDMSSDPTGQKIKAYLAIGLLCGLLGGFIGYIIGGI